MKLAFVGKGGSGKSTVSAFFFLELVRLGKHVLFIDADLNMHVRDLLTITLSEDKNLSLPGNMQKIRTHMIGTSTRIASPDHMYYSTPPSRGCNLLTVSSRDPLVRDYFAHYADNAFVGEVGTYTKDVIGTTCYHTNLAILENLLRFSRIARDEYLIADMVAGVDAFANTMYAQFDAFILAVEPTVESVNVFNQYSALAKETGIQDRILVIYNKIQDASDTAFLDSKIPSQHRLGTVAELKDLKEARRSGLKLDTLKTSTVFDPAISTMLSTIDSLYQDPQTYLERMHTLHEQCSQEDWIRQAVGDIRSQIDTTFTYE
ncbi:MAG: hypothetical protein NBV63_00380 [Candidatus Pacebacteria bacterium]|nr:hypothetical protein [Candidatus Paceibacterota bacterium]